MAEIRANNYPPCFQAGALPPPSKLKVPSDLKQVMLTSRLQLETSKVG